MVEGMPEHLLRRHVSRRPHQHAALRELDAVRLSHYFHEPEAEHLDEEGVIESFREHDVTGLEITMQNAFPITSEIAQKPSLLIGCVVIDKTAHTSIWSFRA